MLRQPAERALMARRMDLHLSRPRSVACVAALCGALAASGAASQAATAATLKVTVSPAKVHPGAPYVVTITGRYNRRTTRTAPYLMAFIQYSGSPCKPRATAEYGLPAAEWSWDFYPPLIEPSSPFKRVVRWTAKTRLGTRHVCAYLYPEKISPSSDVPPLVTASTTFRNLAR
jgi:hypothetical protein